MKTSRYIYLIVLGFTLFNSATNLATARPEYVRHGYFTCTSCHVSPAGGGLLKAYGRMVATEKLVMAGKENEDGFLHGAFEPSENWAVGGGVRYLQTYQDNAKSRKGQVFRMNSDIDGGVRLGENFFKVARLWIAAKIGIEGGPDKSPTGEKTMFRNISPTHYLQLEPMEGIYLRVGRFQTRFGLMIPDHSAAVRRGTGLAAGSETRQVEATLNTKQLDITVSQFYESRDQKIGSIWVNSAASRDEKGQALHASVFVLERYRLGIQGLLGRSDDATRTIAGIHAAFPIGNDWTLLHESDWITRSALTPGKVDRERTRSHLSWSKILYEVTKGVTTFTWLESTRPDQSTSKRRVDGTGFGLTLKPRPHFNFELASGVSLDRENYTYSFNGRAVAHYWF